MVCLERAASRGAGKNQQKSAEAIVVARKRKEGPKLSRVDSHACSPRVQRRSPVATREAMSGPPGPAVPKALGGAIGGKDPVRVIIFMTTYCDPHCQQAQDVVSETCDCALL